MECFPLLYYGTTTKNNLEPDSESHGMRYLKSNAGLLSIKKKCYSLGEE